MLIYIPIVIIALTAFAAGGFAAEVRRILIAKHSYSDAELPTEQTIMTKLNALGYYPQKVAKSEPKKRSPKPTRSSSGSIR